MGRKRDHNQVKRAKGNPGRRRIADKAPEGSAPSEASADGALPSWVNTAEQIKRRRPRSAKERAGFMTDLTQQIWDFIRPELVEMGFAKKVDEPNLAIYCRKFAEFIAATVELDRDGMTYKTESAHSGVIHRLHPAVRIQKDALQAIKELGEILGITPLSRQRLFQMMADASAGRLPIKPEPSEVSPPEANSPIGLLDRSSGATQH